MGLLLVQIGYAIFCLGIAMTVGVGVAKRFGKIPGWVAGIVVIISSWFAYAPFLKFFVDS